MKHKKQKEIKIEVKVEVKEVAKMEQTQPCFVCGVTPHIVRMVNKNEVFVFGSNLKGKHGGGAALTAYNKFGAKWGQGAGLQGRSYGIPTMHGGINSIKPFIDQFIVFASQHPELHFLVTRIGYGTAGFTDAQIAPLFANCLQMTNVSLPKNFIFVLTGIMVNDKKS